MRRAETDLIGYYAEVEKLEGVNLSWRQTARTDTVTFAEGVQDRTEAAAKARGLSTARIVSGAGHDAQELSRIAPAGMIEAIRMAHRRVAHAQGHFNHYSASDQAKLLKGKRV